MPSTSKNFAVWDPELSITEPDVILAAKNGTLKSVRIVKNGQDFYMFVQLSWRKDQELFFATTRTKKKPRQFRNIGRLLEYIEHNFQDIDNIALEILR